MSRDMSTTFDTFIHGRLFLKSIQGNIHICGTKSKYMKVHQEVLFNIYLRDMLQQQENIKLISYRETASKSLLQEETSQHEQHLELYPRKTLDTVDQGHELPPHHRHRQHTVKNQKILALGVTFDPLLTFKGIQRMSRTKMHHIRGHLWEDTIFGGHNSYIKWQSTETFR